MSQVTLYGDCVSGATILSNRFIDIYMGNANDAQIKIYLYLLRCIGGNMPVSVSIIADFFNYTEKDVLRALKYWEKQRLLKLTFSESKQLTEIQLLPIQSIASTTQTALQAVTVEPSTAERTDAKVFRLPEKPNYSKVSTINSYAWCVTPFQV
ncbi:MAG: DNA replication protein DnaD, partial [Parasporobacterium sp.]|nr:DNA replication protein DnaD [Parasporobacterium sp.]